MYFTATSTDVEHAFSRGGLTVSKMRHSLSDESTRAVTVLGSWQDHPGLIPQDDILTLFRNKSKRSKGKGKDIERTDTEVNLIEVDT